jgi:ElaA protein
VAEVSLSVSPLAEIPSPTLYAILRLRVEVFVVEQHAAYPDLDGRDAEAGALLIWATDDEGRVLSTARVLQEPDAKRIGRIATAPDARGRGIAAQVLQRGIELCDGKPIHLDAQTQLLDWYRRFGFEVSGEEYLEDDIPHRPMLRPADSAGPPRPRHRRG